MFKSIEMLPDIFWVGVNDWSIRSFHGYNTTRGASYNAYLIIDEQPTIVDSVKHQFASEYIERIQQQIELTKIKYIVANHAEPDHSSSIPALYEVAPQATIVTNSKCKEHLDIMYPSLIAAKWLIVDNSTQLSIGKRTLSFIPTQMVHWPCNMFTYSQFDKALFSNDAFGQHIATSERWVDQHPIDDIIYLVKEYNANILAHLPVLMRKVLSNCNKVKFDFILTAHGVSWRGSGLDLVLAEYQRFAQLNYESKVTICYDTMYGSTEAAALLIAEGVQQAGARAELVNLNVTSLTTAALHLYDSACFAIGSPSMNSAMMPTISALLCYARGLRLLRNKYGSLFGAFGWAGSPVINDLVEELVKCGAVVSDVKTQWKFDISNQTKGILVAEGFKLGQFALVKK
ncbi:A-type_flavoprotein 2 [Hexamita inflata]|uniref:A-type flavoprotein 2 n=1 Tax=Hexamita inflata TaxID=28002 RepID=A0AA86U6B2_9EUKA|nr:A-type flavoprotein 2 [Hexamita inflata]